MLGEEEKKDTTSPVALSFGYGMVSAWSAVLGYYIYTLYPKIIKTDAWWKVQCPETEYTASKYKEMKNKTEGVNCDQKTAKCPDIVL